MNLQEFARYSAIELPSLPEVADWRQSLHRVVH